MKPPKPPKGTHKPAPKDGSFEPGKPAGNATTGSPRVSAQWHANSEPRDLGEPKKTTRPLSAAETTARVREARRTRSGSEAGPPAHHRTEPPEAAKARTAATAENGPEPWPPGPNAQKQRTKDGGTKPGTANNSAASAPEQQPIANEWPDAARADATLTTKAELDAGSAREPATATTPGELNTGSRQGR